MVAVLSSFLFAATVTVSLTADERILPPEVVATVGGQLVTVAMSNPSGDRLRWEGFCTAWPTVVEATMEDLARNCGRATWIAKTPEMPDVPDLRLGTTPPDPPLSGLAASLPAPEGAFDLFDYVKTYDLPLSELLLPEHMEASGNQGPPGFGEAYEPGPAVTVARADIDDATVAITTASDRPGWAAVDYTILDGRDPAFSTLVDSRGYVKYSTFSVDAPDLLTGRMFDMTDGHPPFVHTWMGKDIQIDALPRLLSPQVPVGWSIYMNDLAYYQGSQGEVLGLNPIHVGHGTTVSHRGWIVGINGEGILSISGPVNSGEGPYLIGVLARNTSNPQDADTCRFLFTKGLLAECYPYPSATHDKSETLDGLALGPIPSPDNPSRDTRVPIQGGSHWGYHFVGGDGTLTPAPLEVVDLMYDRQLPKAAHPASMNAVLAEPAVAAIAGRKALKATFHPTGSLPTPGMRLMSRAFTNLRPGDIITFAANIATDVQDATHSPDIDMALVSGWGEVCMGFHLSSLAITDHPGVQGTPLAEYQPTIVPWADEGWQTLSVNYTPPLSSRFMDVDGDGVCDRDDFELLAYHPTHGSLPREGWEDGLAVARATLRVKTRPSMTDTFHVWLDNLRVYRSGYELDLALAKIEYTEPVSMEETFFPPGTVRQTAGKIDGTFDSYVDTGDIRTDLSNTGWTVVGTAGQVGIHLREPFGRYPSTARFANPHDSTFSVRQGIDHTGNSHLGKCLQISLVSPDGLYAYEGDYVAVRARVDSAMVAVPDSGIYCFEAYVSKEWATNMVAARQTPSMIIGLMEMAPNSFEYVAGAFFDRSGLPASVSDPENPWMRVVGTAYIPGAQLVRGFIQVWDPLTEPVSNYRVPILIDDCHIYQVDDPAHFFDADLFDVL